MDRSVGTRLFPTDDSLFPADSPGQRCPVCLQVKHLPSLRRRCLSSSGGPGALPRGRVLVTAATAVPLGSGVSAPVALSRAPFLLGMKRPGLVFDEDRDEEELLDTTMVPTPLASHFSAQEMISFRCLRVLIVDVVLDHLLQTALIQGACLSLCDISQLVHEFPESHCKSLY